MGAKTKTPTKRKNLLDRKSKNSLGIVSGSNEERRR